MLSLGLAIISPALNAAQPGMPVVGDWYAKPFPVLGDTARVYCPVKTVTADKITFGRCEVRTFDRVIHPKKIPPPAPMSHELLKDYERVFGNRSTDYWKHHPAPILSR